MHTLIVCGTPWCNTGSLFKNLVAAGLAPPLPAQRASIASPKEWHDRLFANELALPRKTLRPGKAWELAASEVFLANWNRPVWGWEDFRSSWLLEFWRDFDPHTHFIFVHTSAAAVLAAAASQSKSSDFNTVAVLESWCAYQTEFLRFYHRNRTRCVWLLGDTLANSATVHAVNQAFGLKLQHPTGSGGKDIDKRTGDDLRATRATPDTATALFRVLAQDAVHQHAQTIALQREIWATLTGTDGQPKAPSLQLDAASGMNLLSELVMAHQQEVQGKIDVQNIKLLTAQRERDELAKANIEARQELGAAQQEVHRQERQERDLQQAYEQLLFEMHQLQEELEQTYLSSQEMQREVDAAHQSRQRVIERLELLEAARHAEAEAKTDAMAARDAQAHLVSELQQALNAANLANEEKSQSAHGDARILAATEAQVVQLTGACAAEAQAKEDALAKVAALTHEKAALIATCNSLVKEREELSASAERAVQQRRTTEEALNQENVHLLLELNHVQEELEHSLLQHQKSLEENLRLQARWAKLMVRYPDYCEWSHIEATEDQSRRWRIRDLKVGGREVPLLDIALAAPDTEAPTLVLTSPDIGNQSLLYCPPNSADAVEPLRIQPTADPSSAAGQVIRSLAPSDLRFLQIACGVLVEWLAGAHPQDKATARLLRTVQRQLQDLPPTWRFDAVKLAHEQVNPDYEHLWFSVQNAVYGNRRWKNFEFRLSAANVRRGKFSTMPKLEFPLPDEGDKQFENWFEESEDDRGPKFELRFETKTPAIDINAWKALSAMDQAQALSLVAHLPAILTRLQHQGFTIRRPWTDWHGLATSMQHVLHVCLGLPDNALKLA